MVDVRAVSMVGGTIFHREMIQREISRALVLNLSGKKSGASARHRISLSLTEPSLLSRGTRLSGAPGIAKVAKAAGIERESLYRALSERGNPRLSTLVAVTKAVGLRLTVEAAP
jgi:hypothetical protein